MKDKIRLGYFADGPWSHEAFKLLIRDPSIDIAFIVPRTDTKDNTLREFAEENRIDYITPILINSDNFYEKAKAYNCDLFVSMSFNQIFRERISSLPPLKTINCHAGSLPFYRGRNILNWVLINDEPEFGITVHYIDNGIDTGDIILQRKYPISDSDTYATLLEVAYTECANILYEAIKQIQAGTQTTTKQTDLHPVGFYCGVRGLGDEVINWNQTSRELFNFIRSICKPGPMAATTKEGIPVMINKARMIPDAPAYKCTSGQLVGKTNNGFLVKTSDTVIEILEIETQAKLRVGDKLK